MRPFAKIGVIALAAAAIAGAAASQPGQNLAEDKKATPPGPPPIVENAKEIEPGVYMCVEATSKGPFNQPAPTAVNIQDDANYLLYTNNGEAKEPGNYGFEKGVITWKSGPLKGQPNGKYDGDAHVEPNQMRLQVQPAGAPLMSCYMYDGPA